MIKDKYGPIAGNRAINAMIYRCFEELDEGDQLKFVKKFRKQSSDATQVMHTFRELILGAYLHSLGFRVRYEQKLQDKTPDWVIEDDQSVPQAIVELVNFHIDRTTEREIQKKIQKIPAVVTIWRDENGDNLKRLYERIEEKMISYGELVNTLSLAYIVAVFGSFEVALDADEVLACLEWRESPLFAQYPHVSGVLFFDETSGGYGFRYFENPGGLWKPGIMPGVFSR